MAGLEHVANLFVARYGLVALFVLITIEEAGLWLPVPSDVFIIYFAYRAVRTPQPVLGVAQLGLTIVLAVVCGSLLLYLLARRYHWLLRRFERFLHFNEARLEQMEGFVRRHGVIVIIPVRLIPGLRILPTIVSGASNVPLKVFVPAVAASALIWALLLFAIGAGGSAILRSLHQVQQAATPWIFPMILLAGVLVTALDLWQAHVVARRRAK